MNMFNYEITGSKFKKKILNQSEKRYKAYNFSVDKKEAQRLRGDKCEKNLFNVTLTVFTDYTTRKANGMASEQSYKNQNSVQG